MLDTASGKPVAGLEISGDVDDLFYDARRRRLYLSCGEGFVDAVEQRAPDNHRRLAKVPTARGARTAFFSPELDRYCLAVPARGGRQAEIRIFQPE